MDDQQRISEIYQRMQSEDPAVREKAQAELQEMNNRLLEKRFTWMKENISEGHPLYTMIREHEQILGFLDQLEAVNERLQQATEVTADSPDIKELARLADNLVGAEKHHEREEDALFPLLEQVGLSGPPSMMRDEHDEMRIRKHKLQELAQSAGKMELAQFKSELDEVAKYITYNLRDHIFKEDHILYPAALQTIKSEAWEKVKQDCDQIGYCPFTPKD